MASSKKHREENPGTVRSAIDTLTLIVVIVLGLVTTYPAQAQRYSVLYSFTGGTDGGISYAALVRDKAGNLYGTTSIGGDFSCAIEGCGTVFKLSPRGKEIVLHSFTGIPDGVFPDSGLIRDGAGNFYGTTESGGGTGCDGYGCGAVFEVNKTGENIFYGFTGKPDGDAPSAGLTMDASRNLYGTTQAGGSSGAGTVYEVHSLGKETVLYSFTGATDGAYPYGELVRDGVGNLYGTTESGGSSNQGTVFRVNANGEETVLYSFTGGKDGGSPLAGLVRDQEGNLYGTTFYGGSGNGVVFKLEPRGRQTVLHSFMGPPDGRLPGARLLRDSSGNLYGTTEEGGDSNCLEGFGCGTIFKVDAKGKETVLYRFTGFPDGELPLAGLIMDTSGNLYGTTGYGGYSNSPCTDGSHISGCGVVFKLTP